MDRFKQSFTSYTGGYYQACIENTSSDPSNVTFSLKYGVAAKDYSEVAKAKDLKPIDLDVKFFLKKSCKNYMIKAGSFTI